MSEDELISESGHYMLLYQNGEAKLYDLFTGEAKEDSWVHKQFCQSADN